MKKIIGFIACASLLTACSPIDSLKPFDQQQAAIWVKENYALKSTQQCNKN